MDFCPACSATSPAGSAWCMQCFAPLAVEVPAEVRAEPSRVLVGAGVAAGDMNRFGLPAAEAAPPLPVTDVPAEASGSMLSRQALVLVAIAIGVGAVGMAVSWLLGRDGHMEPATYLRYALALTLGVYVIVGALITVRLVPGIRLRWHTGRPASGILLGATVGGVLSALLLAAVSSASGHLSPDPRIVTLMSEGDIAHIVATIGITCLCAPLIEEVLFRGLLLESLRVRGRRVALSASGVAFAVWHLNPSALRYYSLMGLLLGVLYMKRGLVCSMAAHAAFNGVLTVAALAVVLAPARTVTAGDLSFSAASGWSHLHSDADGWVLSGPSGAEVFVAEQELAVPPTADEIFARMQSGMTSVPLPGVSFDASTVRKTPIAAGVAVEVDIHYDGHGGTLAVVTGSGRVVEMVLMNAGSTKAQAEFPQMLQSLRVP